jgi:hypothetical protein
MAAPPLSWAALPGTKAPDDAKSRLVQSLSARRSSQLPDGGMRTSRPAAEAIARISAAASTAIASSFADGLHAM